MPYEFCLNNQLIWSNQNFIHKTKEIVNSDRYYSPYIINDKIVEISGWKINITATIDATTTSESLINNYKITKDKIGFPIQELARPFVLLHAVQIYKNDDIEKNLLFEPYIILYLRFCYWYGECSKYCNMELKNKEIRDKIKPSNDIIKQIQQKNSDDNSVKPWYREKLIVINDLMNA